MTEISQKCLSQHLRKNLKSRRYAVMEKVKTFRSAFTENYQKLTGPPARNSAINLQVSGHKNSKNSQVSSFTKMLKLSGPQSRKLAKNA